MAESAIEWTEVTWNPTTGCDRTSPGCDNCGERLADHVDPHVVRLSAALCPEPAELFDEAVVALLVGLDEHEHELVLPSREEGVSNEAVQSKQR